MLGFIPNTNGFWQCGLNICDYLGAPNYLVAYAGKSRSSVSNDPLRIVPSSIAGNSMSMRCLGNPLWMNLRMLCQDPRHNRFGPPMIQRNIFPWFMHA